MKHTHEIKGDTKAETGRRLREARVDNDLTQEEAANQVGLTKSTLSPYESRAIKSLKLTVVQALSELYDVNPLWLVCKSDDRQIKVPALMPYDKPLHRIPIIGHIAAGLPKLTDEMIDGYTYTDLNHGHEYFALKVEGDSMSAASIPDGSLLIVRRQPMVENGEIAVVRVNDDTATVKRFSRKGDIVTLSPQSYNPVHQVQVYDLKEDIISIIGKAVECKVEL